MDAASSSAPGAARDPFPFSMESCETAPGTASPRPITWEILEFITESHVDNRPARGVVPYVTKPASTSLFLHKPDFVMDAAFFAGDPIVTLAYYECEVLRHIREREHFEIRKQKLEVSYEFTHLRLTVPAHCGYRGIDVIWECDAQTWDKWYIHGLDYLVQALHDLHLNARLVYPDLRPL